MRQSTSLDYNPIMFDNYAALFNCAPVGRASDSMMARHKAAHSAYDMFSWCKYLIVNLVFSHLGFWSGNLFLIATFPDLCLLVPFYNALCPRS